MFEPLNRNDPIGNIYIMGKRLWIIAILTLLGMLLIFIASAF